MELVYALQKAVDFIEGNITNSLDTVKIAKFIHSSHFHFQRTFHVFTGMNVQEYIRKRRLSLATDDLINTQESVLQIALKYHYETAESFSKAFKKQHQATPTQIRKREKPAVYYNRLAIHVELRGSEPMKVQIVDKESFRIVGKKRSFSYANGENLRGIPLMWNELNAEGIGNQLIPTADHYIEGLLGVCQISDENTKLMDYWIAISSEEKVEGMEELIIPAAKWAVFEITGSMPEAMQNGFKKIMTEWLPTSGYKTVGDIELEVYGDGDVQEDNYVSYIWLMIL